MGDGLRFVQPSFASSNGVIRVADHVDKGCEDQVPSLGAWLPGSWIPRYYFPDPEMASAATSLSMYTEARLTGMGGLEQLSRSTSSYESHHFA
jgi:hypothetical protein